MDKGEPRIVLLTKIEPPQSSPTALPRSSLLGVLQKNRKKKLILICAGAGYGKTTLVTQLLSKRELKYMYYQLDADDVDPATFMSYLLIGFRRFDSRFGKKTEGLSEFFNNFKRYQDIIIGTFLNEVVERFKDDMYIVLEDYHTLRSPCFIDSILDYMLKNMPPKLHIIITSRTMPGLQLSKLKACDEVLELTTQHLRFSLKEIEKFFKRVYTKPLKEKEIEWIEQHSEGWPTSLRLMLQSAEYLEGIKSSHYVREILDNYYQSQSHLFNYFAQEIFNNESGSTQQFLVDCSLFDWLTPQFCDAITARGSCGKILSRLTHRNAFLFKIQSKGYRFHHLYQDFLRSKMTNLQRERTLYRRAAAYYSKQKRYEEAIKFYIRGGQYNQVCKLVVRIGYLMIKQGRGSILGSFIEAIPMQLRNSEPDVLIMYAQSLVHMGRAEEGRNVLLRAVRFLKDTKKRKMNHADALYELGGISLYQDKYKEARRFFMRALKACPRRVSLTRAAILNSLGFVNSALGGRYMSKAENFFKQAYRIAHRKNYGELEASVLNNWALHDWKSGDIHPAYQKLTDMVSILDTHYSPHCGAGYFNAARICLLSGKTREARHILDSGSRVCGPYNDQWSMATLWKGYGLLHRSLGEYNRAKKYLTRSLKVYEDLGIVRLAITSLNELCRVHTMLGEYNDAEKNLSAIWWFKKDKQDSEAVNIMITEAQLRIAQKKYDQAVRELESTLKLAHRFKHPLQLFYAHVELSRVFHAKDVPCPAREHIQKAVVLCRMKGYEYLLQRVFEHDPWMVQLLQQERFEQEYVSSVIMGSEKYTRAIEMFIFGKPRFLVEGTLPRDNIWKTKNAEKLFYYLLLHKGERINSDHLIQIFWPGTGLSAGRFNLRKTIQYIRQALARIDTALRDIICSGKGVYSISKDIFIVSDIDQFDRLTAKLRMDQGQGRVRKADLEMALRMYRGDFATGWYDNWVEEKRQYYKSMYEEILSLYALNCIEEKEFRDAMRYYRKLLDLNIFEESYHRNFMIACAQCKRHKDIIQDYKRLTAALKKDLGKEPEPETTRLYHRLINK